MALFGTQRDVSLFRHMSRELMADIITEQCGYYKYKLEETKINLYGEADQEKYYDGPFIFNVLINRTNEQYAENIEGVQFGQPIEFYFFRDDIKDADILIRVGDIILYQESYYGVQSTVANQYWGGKNPSYPNNINPLNPGLENYGNNLSVLVSTYYIPADKVAISPYQERM